MLTKEQELYSRYVRLLRDCGTRLLQLLAEKALNKKGMTLGQFLTTNQTTIQNNRHITRAQKSTLYPGTPQVADIYDFDISLLSLLILKYLVTYLEPSELRAVEQLRDIRNKHGHSSETEMTTETYKTERISLVLEINSGSSELPVREQRELIEIQFASLDDPVDVETVKEMQEYIRQSHDTIKDIEECARKTQETVQSTWTDVSAISEKVDTLSITTQQTSQDVRQSSQQIANQITSVASNIQDARLELQIILQQILTALREISQPRENIGVVRIPDLSCEITIEANDQGTVIAAQCILYTQFQGHFDKYPPEDKTDNELRKYIERFLQDTHKLQVIVTRVVKGSIILKLTAVSVESILSLMDYLNSPQCQDLLQEMAQVITKDVVDVVDITACVNEQSLQNIISYICTEYDIHLSTNEQHPSGGFSDQQRTEQGFPSERQTHWEYTEDEKGREDVVPHDPSILFQTYVLQPKNAIHVKECSYLGRSKPRRLICAGKYLKNGKIVFIDRKKSVLLLTDPTTEYMTEKDLVPLLQKFDFKHELTPNPSDVNEGFEDDQLLITFTGIDFSLGIVCKFTMQAEEFVLEPIPPLVKVNKRTRSLVVLDKQHVCASTEQYMQVLNREGGVVAEFRRQTRDRGGLLMTDGNGRFYYGDGDHFCCCLWDGNKVAEEFRVTHKNMVFPRGSAISGEGNILVCCDTTKNIFQLSQAGEFLNILAGVQMKQNGDIDVHPDGKTFFTTFWEENEWPMLYRLAE